MLLSIGGKKIIPFDWKPHDIQGDESGYVNFDTPQWLLNGNHSARLTVYTPYGYSKSQKFTIFVN